MRLAASIPHPSCKISIFSWNEKWIIEIEAGAYKQTYKISQDSLGSLEDAKRLVTDELLRKTMDRFREMHADFAVSFQNLNNLNS